MRLLPAALVLFIATILGAPAHAASGGFALGFKLGYGVPTGSVAKDATTGSTNLPLSDELSGKLPLDLDVGYFVTPQLFVGTSFQIAYGLVNDQRAFSPGACTGTGSSCSGTDLRVGLVSTFRFGTDDYFEPWVGLGVGYEWTKLHGEDATGSGDMTLRGFDLALQVGGYFSVSSTVSFGPYVAYNVGQYRSMDISSGSFSDGGEIPKKAFHGWFQVGMRGTFGPW